MYTYAVVLPSLVFRSLDTTLLKGYNLCALKYLVKFKTGNQVCRFIKKADSIIEYSIAP